MASEPHDGNVFFKNLNNDDSFFENYSPLSPDCPWTDTEYVFDH